MFKRLFSCYITTLETNTLDHKYVLMTLTLLHFYLLLSFSPLGPGITPDLRRQVNIIAHTYIHTDEYATLNMGSFRIH